MKLTWTKPDIDGMTYCVELPVSIVASVELDHGEPRSWHIVVGKRAPVDYLEAGSYSGAKRAVERIANHAASYDNYT